MKHNYTLQQRIESFITRVSILHNYKFDYSKVAYINIHTKIVIICPIHGEFLQTPAWHLEGTGCPMCHLDKTRLSLEKFIAKARKVHGDRYDYSKVIYKNMHTKVIITCPIHSDFEQTPINHISGGGCSVCFSDRNRLTLEEFIIKARKIHGNRYDYSKVVYINNNTKIIIICPIHGDFEQIPNNHLNGYGCPLCSSSKGELRVRNFLVTHKIEYKREYKLPNSLYRYDFYLPKLNILIEYDGIQHFKPIDTYGGIKAFIKQKESDKGKNQLARMYNIHLIRIPYTDLNALENIILHQISRLYRYRVKNKFYKTFLDLCRGLTLSGGVKSKDVKQYLVYKKVT